MDSIAFYHGREMFLISRPRSRRLVKLKKRTEEEYNSMKSPFVETLIQGRCVIVIGLLSLLSSNVCWAISDIHSNLLKQPTRPTVLQIKELLTHWTPAPLQNETRLPKDVDKLRLDLQNNFPVWYSALISGGPQMIATFENAFPGATWAFIGRDMAIIADLFEAFYRSIGQTERVARIGMSRGTLKGLTSDLGTRLLESHGLKIQAGMHPFILVDAVSRGGGRQGRFLLNSVYATRRDKWSSADLLPYFNFIGLRVLTTQIPFRSLVNAQERIQNHQNTLINSTTPLDFNRYEIFSYVDNHVVDRVIGTNEAGYSHWTGAWHGSYGPVILANGEVLASIGTPSS
jgi:hypothetical protein